MKYLTLFFIYLYHLLGSPLLKAILGAPHMCRYQPSCSAYTAFAIKRFGVIRGAWLGGMRLLACQPLGKGAFIYEK